MQCLDENPAFAGFADRRTSHKRTLLAFSGSLPMLSCWLSWVLDPLEWLSQPSCLKLIRVRLTHIRPTQGGPLL